MKVKFNVGKKVKIIKDIPSINGMLHEGTVVKIDEISHGSPFRGSIRVVDSLGKIWWVSSNDIDTSYLS